MPITRTPIIDDDGTGTTGTVIDNAWKQQLYDQIDAFGEAAWVDMAPLTYLTREGSGWTANVQRNRWRRIGRNLVIWQWAASTASWANTTASLDMWGLPFQLVAPGYQVAPVAWGVVPSFVTPSASRPDVASLQRFDQANWAPQSGFFLFTALFEVQPLS